MSARVVLYAFAHVFIIIKISRESRMRVFIATIKPDQKYALKIFEFKLVKHAVHTGMQIFL